MPTDIIIPELGESINSGVITSWRKSEGDRVERDETLLELETDKITLELPAPASGVLKRKASEGDTVEVGAVVGSIDESDSGGAAGNRETKSSKRAEPEKDKPDDGREDRSTSRETKKSDESKHESSRQGEDDEKSDEESEKSGDEEQRKAKDKDSDRTPDADAAEVRATPLARKMAEEHNIDVSRISGTGPGGRVREQDVLAVVQSRSGGETDTRRGSHAPSKQDASRASRSSERSVTRERLSPLRHRIAQRLVEAQHTAAMLTTFNECDMTAVMAVRSRHKEEFEKRHGVGLGFMSFFVSAAVSGLRAFPLVNASLVENDKGELEIEKRSYFDVAIAVGTPKGLTVPVLRDCQSRSFAQVEDGIRDLATRARDGKLALEELQGGTFTITNGGVYGSMLSTPILNPPQSAILGMHNIVRRPIENPDKPGSGEVVVRPMMYLALSYDHRIIDGAEAVSFLVHIKKCIEDPSRMLLGV